MGSLLGLEEENCAVAEVEVYEMLRFVGDEASEISADYTMPSRAFSFVELRGYLLELVYCKGEAGRGKGKVYSFLDVLCNVLVGVCVSLVRKKGGKAG